MCQQLPASLVIIALDGHSLVVYPVLILLPPPCFAANYKVSLPPTHVPDFTWTTEKRKTLLSLLAIIPLLGFHLPVISTTYIAEVYANEYYANYSFLVALSYVRSRHAFSCHWAPVYVFLFSKGNKLWLMACMVISLYINCHQVNIMVRAGYYKLLAASL